MSTFTPEWDGLPSEDEISEFLAFAGCDDLGHPYDAFPATDRPRPSWRGGPRIGAEAEDLYREEQHDRD